MTVSFYFTFELHCEYLLSSFYMNQTQLHWNKQIFSNWLDELMLFCEFRREQLNLTLFRFVLLLSDRNLQYSRSSGTLLIVLKYDKHMKIDYFSVDFMRCICFTGGFLFINSFVMTGVESVVMNSIYCMRIGLATDADAVVVVVAVTAVVPSHLTHNKCT